MKIKPLAGAVCPRMKHFKSHVHAKGKESLRKRSELFPLYLLLVVLSFVFPAQVFALGLN